MTSPLQIVTNRQNAKASTGPRTNEGKQVAARNSIRHGILSRQIVLPWEDREQFDGLRETLVLDNAPATAFELHLVEQLAALMWRQRRIADIEAWEARRKMGKAAEQGYGYDPENVFRFRGLATSEDVDVGETLFSPAEHNEQQLAEVKVVLRAIENSIHILEEAKPDAYERALAALPSGTQEWWDDTRKDKPALKPTSQFLQHWLAHEPHEHFTRRPNDLNMSDERRDDLCGFASKAIVASDTVMRYEVHISRQIERTVTLLDRTRLMRTVEP